MVITIKDESATGKLLHEFEMEFKTETVTVRDIIMRRVYREVEQYNKKTPLGFNGLVQPTDAEKTLNGVKPKKVVDAEKQAYVALHAFQNNGFFVLIDNTQAEDLDEEVLLHSGMAVSFIKLTQLVGG
ncbi:hypothetical protein [Mucilaginibacter pedocola]|uniref:Uncharacterized protein n=1 Tax=Mucilaginibacter pedocola TaxID=1792845 RepID=A0A1S9P903_9SPHI|nr:hypothetical protein [Mucilaginibacter pedocola]OOQ57317.1 hypothetical protein BC343_14480 [Mucilaginibacter pedocola]